MNLLLNAKDIMSRAEKKMREYIEENILKCFFLLSFFCHHPKRKKTENVDETNINIVQGRPAVNQSFFGLGPHPLNCYRHLYLKVTTN